MPDSKSASVTHLFSRRHAPALFESLENRQLLSVSLDSNGWTVVTPGADTHIIYVSSSQGNDANSGFSEDAPVQTVAKGRSLLRNGAGDQMLLKRGDTWHESLGYWKISGLSPDQPTLIGAYGTGARPELDVGSTYAFGAGTPSATLHDVVIEGIHLYAASRDPSNPQYDATANSDGVYIAGNVQNMLFEDDSVDFFQNNFVVSDYYAPITNFQVRRSNISDAYSATSVHSQGMYIQGVHGILLEGNTFDHNGWNETVPHAVATIFNHDVYCQGTSTDLVARNNIFSNSSSHGLQARAGGIIENNVFLNDPIGLSYGLVNGSGPLVAGGVTGDVTGNVFMGGNDIHGQPRGIGLEIANISTVGAVVQKNVFANSYSGGLFAAIDVTVGNNLANPQDAVGISNLTIEDNIVNNWERGIWVDPAMHNGGTGPRSVNGLTIENNDFQAIKSSNIVYHGIGIDSSVETIGGNRYSSVSSSGAPFYMAGQSYSAAQWFGSVEPTGEAVQAQYDDPTRSISTLSFALGGLGTEADFLAHAQENSSTDYLFSYTAAAAANYIRAGFTDTSDSTPAIPGGWVLISTPLPAPISGPETTNASGTGTDGTGTDGSGDGSSGGTTGGDGTGTTGSGSGTGTGSSGGGTTNTGDRGGDGSSGDGTSSGGTSSGGGTTSGSGSSGTGSSGSGTSSGGTTSGGTTSGSGGTSSGGTVNTGDRGGDGTTSGGTTTGSGSTSGTGGTSSGGSTSGGTSSGGTAGGTGSTSSGGTSSGGTASGGGVTTGGGSLGGGNVTSGGGSVTNTDGSGSGSGTTGGSTTGGSTTGGSTTGSGSTGGGSTTGTPSDPGVPTSTGSGDHKVVIWYTNRPTVPVPIEIVTNPDPAAIADASLNVIYVALKIPHLEFAGGYWYIVS